MSLIDSISVDRSVSPVRDGPGLGGGFDARLKKIDFGNTESLEPHVDITSQYDTANDSWSAGGVAGASSARYRFNVLGAYEKGSNTRIPGGEIADSGFKRDTYGVNGGVRLGEGEFGLEVRRQDTGATGNPPLPMDILFFHTTFTQATYRGMPSDGLSLDAAIGYADVDHAMDNFSHRTAPGMPTMYRRTNATSDALTGHVNFQHGDAGRHLAYGLDFESANRDATIVNPNNPDFYVDALPGIEKRREGVFLEWRTGMGQVQTELGMRVDHHTMSADTPRIGPVLPMGAQMLAGAFAASDRDWSDNTLDVVASFWSDQGAFTPRLTLARKTRTANAVERFSWLPTETSGGLADGNVYVGDENLKTETAWIAEAGLDWRGDGASVRPTVYYRRIEDYIQGVPYDSTPGVVDSTVEMVASMNGDSTPLRFANVGAEFYGADLDFGLDLMSHLQLDGALSYVRAKRTDVHDNLYRIAPPHLRLGLKWVEGAWSVTLEGIAYAAQHHVSATNGEQSSSGYAVTNISGQWTVRPGVSLSAGIENLFDRNYAPHLAGYNRVNDSDVPVGARLPAPGRSGFLGFRIAM